MESAATKENPYAWAMVAIGGLMGCIAIGAVFSLAVFLQPMAQDTGWSRTAISGAMTLNFLAMGVGSFAWGALSDRFGTRIVVLAGSVVLGSCLALASRATSEAAFLLIYGVLVGAAAGSIFVPLITAVSAWFDKHRGLAVSLVSAGMGMAPLTMSPLAAWLIERMDWRSAQRTDLPHRDLRDRLRPADDGGGQHLQPRGAGGPRRASDVGTARGSVGCQAGPDHRALRPGACRRCLHLRAADRALLCDRGPVRLCLRRRHAALRRARARLLRPAHPRHGVGRGDDYTGLYLGSLAMGLAAALLAFAFPPTLRPVLRPLSPGPSR